WANYAENNYWRGDLEGTFAIGLAQQWLALGRFDRAWATLTAFWQHQNVPGLYTWGNDSSLESTFDKWKTVRGWLKGQESVTPSYTVAARILLLQLSMLADVEETQGQQPTVVIGAGVEPAWIGQRMTVQNLSTPLGPIDWSWDGRQMSVNIHGAPARVRLGPAFPHGAPIQLGHAN